MREVGHGTGVAGNPVAIGSGTAFHDFKNLRRFDKLNSATVSLPVRLYD